MNWGITVLAPGSWIRPFTLAICAVAVLSVGPGSLVGENASKELIAVMELTSQGAKPEEASAITNQLRTELFNSGKYTLVDRSQLDAILNEQAFQQMGCTTDECAVHVGRILGVRKIVAGSVAKLSAETWQVSIVMLDVETAETMHVQTGIHEGSLTSLLIEAVPKFAARFMVSQPLSSARSKAIVGQGVPPSRVWERTLGGGRRASIRALAATSDGGTILVAEEDEFTALLFRVDGEGNQLWQRTLYDAIGGVSVRNVQVVADGGFVLVGTKGRGGGWIVRYDSAGIRMWEQLITPDGRGGEFVSAVPLDNITFLCVGWTVSHSGFQVGWVVRFDREGNVIGDQRIGDEESNTEINAAVNVSGGVVLVGTRHWGVSGNSIGWASSLAPNGRVNWEIRYGEGVHQSRFQSVVPTEEGGFFLVGEQWGERGSTLGTSPFVVRIDSSGQQLFWRTVERFRIVGAGENSLVTVYKGISDSKGGLLLVGVSFHGEAKQQGWMMRMDPDGNELWEIAIGDSQNHAELRSAAVGRDGHILAGGWTYSDSFKVRDGWLVMLDQHPDR